MFPIVTIGNKLCTGTLNGPYSREAKFFISVKLYAPVCEYMRSGVCVCVHEYAAYIMYMYVQIASSGMQYSRVWGCIMSVCTCTN